MSLFKKLWQNIKDVFLGRQTKQQKEESPAPEEEATPTETKTPSKKPVYDSLCCPYCESKKFVRRGFRKKKYEKLQLYLCLNCHKTFSPVKSGGGQYPLETVFDAICLYNQGYSLEESCKAVASSQFPVLSSQSLKTENSMKTENCELKNSVSTCSLSPSTLSDWLEKYKEYCKYSRMREFATIKYAPKDTVETATLAHRQLYRYRFHRAKCALMILQEFQHRKFEPLKEFLELVTSECPHQYFSQGLRASEAPLTFSKKQMIVRSKQNYATKLCQFVLQGVTERDKRHNAIQKFFLYNDSVTVATEVPVYLTREDLLHMQTQLGFEIFNKTPCHPCESRDPDVDSSLRWNDTVSFDSLPKLITGHIDLLQIRNGQIHILDYKPNAAKEQPIDQLTIYAMALSRLTGLRLFEFKCAWFDEKDYFEFFPLHVLYKPNKTKRRKKVKTIEGTYQINVEEKKVSKVRPEDKRLVNVQVQMANVN